MRLGSPWQHPLPQVPLRRRIPFCRRPPGLWLRPCFYFAGAPTSRRIRSGCGVRIGSGCGVSTICAACAGLWLLSNLASLDLTRWVVYVSRTSVQAFDGSFSWCVGGQVMGFLLSAFSLVSRLWVSCFGIWRLVLWLLSFSASI